MKVKLFKKVLAVLVCFGMSVGLLPFAGLSDVRAEAEEVALTNAGFEEDTQIPGWTRDDGATEENMSITSSEGEVYSGENALKLYDSGAESAPWLFSEEAEVTTGSSITLSAWVKVESGTAQLSIKYVGADGNISYKDYGDITATDWKQVTVSDTMPENTSRVGVFIWSGLSSAAVAYYDDITLECDGTGENLLKNNPGFEEAVLIPGWNRIYGNGSEFSISNSVYKSGSRSLKVADGANDASKWMYSDAVSLNEGDQLTATAQIKVEAGALEFCIKYLDDSDTEVGQYPDTTVGVGDWSSQSVSGEVPQGATKAIIFIYSGMGAVTTAYVDDVALSVETASDPAEPPEEDLFPKELVNYDCGSLTALKEQGWVVGDPAEGIYTTDHTNSTGNVDAYVMKPVPEGQILSYMDNSAEDGAVDAFKIVSDKFIIGQSPWKLELDMKIQNLVAADPGNVVSGFSIMVNTGEMLNRINLGGDGKIRVETGWAEPYPDCAESDVDLHIGDGYSHKWAIEGNGKGKVTVSCDGETVASFKGIEFYDSWEPGIQFINYNSDISAGANEIYFDNIKYTVYLDNPGAGIEAGTPADLGPMVESGNPLLLYSMIAKNNATGEDELYTCSTGSADNPSTFYALDPYTGEVRFSAKIAGTTHLYGIAQGSDGNIYFAGVNDGILYKYLPAEKKIVNIGSNPCQSWVWDLVASNDNKIYGATFGDSSTGYGKVFEYDIEADKFTDLGTVKNGADYVRGLGVTDKYIYAGVGIPDALIRIDRDTLEKTEISIPAFGEIPGTGTEGRMCAHVWSYNGKLFIRNNAMKLFVLDEATYQLMNVLSFQQAISAPSPYDSNIVYYKYMNALWEYNCETNTAKKADNSPVLSDYTANSLHWFTPADGEKAGRHLLGITDDAGEYTVYDPVDNSAEVVMLQTEKQAVDIQSLEKGPDGRLYMGGYQYGAAVYNPAASSVEWSAPKMDQPEGIGFMNGKVYFGTYGSARIYRYNLSMPFNFSTDASGNPGLFYDIGNDQDRPFVLTSGDNKLFIGTVPDYGMLGGALTVYDSVTGKWAEYPDIVKNQSIAGLAYKDGKLYGSTSRYGGLGIEPTEEQAKIFIWDAATNEKVDEFTLEIPGMDHPEMIGSLSFGPDGLLWGVADGALFAMDASTREIVKSKVLFNVDYSQDSTWRPYYLRWGPDGLLYSTIGRRLVAFDTQTMGYDVLLGYAPLAVLGDNGNVYYASGSKLMELPIIRKPENEALYEKGRAVLQAVNAIDMLPGYFEIAISDKAAIRTARLLVNTAIGKGAQDADIANIHKLELCENRLKTLEDSEDSTPATPSEPEVTPPSPTPENGKIVKTPKIEGDTATVSISADEFSKALAGTKAGADGVKRVTIETAKADGAARYVQQLPAEALSAGDGKVKIEMKTPVGTVVISDNMFTKENTQNVENIGISIGYADISGLDEKVRKEIGERPVIELYATMDGKRVNWNNPKAPAEVSIDYAPTADELKDPEHIVIWYIDGNGNIISVPSGRYDPETGKVTFTTTHFSMYAVAYVRKTFNDISKSYAGKQIEVLASKGIINGTSDVTYSPKNNITRADFTVLLIKTLGLEAEIDSGFSDIKSTDYFYYETGVAKKLGIAEGIGNNKFNPGGLISRQDMMVLTHRALKAAGKISGAADAPVPERFDDVSDISDYAVGSVSVLVNEGIIEGDGGRINPRGNTTREEAAVLIYRIYYR